MNDRIVLATYFIWLPLALSLSRLQMTIVADNVGADGFETLSAPHTALLAIKQEPPKLFNSTPRFLLDIAPAPGSTSTNAGECTRAELRCKGDKEAFARFAAALDKTRERAVNKSRANPEDEMDLRECLLPPSLLRPLPPPHHTTPHTHPSTIPPCISRPPGNQILFLFRVSFVCESAR